MKKFRYALEALVVKALITLFHTLSPEHASNCGGALARTVGPYMSVSRRAARHIQNSLKTDTHATQPIVRDMWDNLGRVFAEYPHLHTITTTRTEVQGAENLGDIPKGNTSAIFFAGHLANWEVAAPALRRFGIDVDLIYRAPNNPYLQDILDKCRSIDGTLKTYPKSAKGMRDVMKALKDGRRIGILIDQKYNQGVEADFFGQPAMTSMAFIQLAKKFNCPLVPIQVERLPDARFQVTIHKPLDTHKDDRMLLMESHALLENWIAAAPAHWLWLHKRWKTS